MKRLFDIAVAIVLIPIWIPLLALCALAVAFSMGRPVFFRQTRIGRGERPFTILKLRTMRQGAGSDGERITRLGAFLRRTSLDELPQFVNILRGEMSLVGPRPLLPEYLPLYDARQRRRHEVRPGITGLAQTSGRNAISWEKRLELDVQYVEKRSFALDMCILVRTIAAAISGRGVSAEGEATMPPFAGRQ